MQTQTKAQTKTHIGKSGISAKVIADSVNLNGNRMLTFEIEYPRFILAELNTHCMLEKNSASSRAIPKNSMHEEIMQRPAMPVFWGKNKSGMQADEELEEINKQGSIAVWLSARDTAVACSKVLFDIGNHKQIANRITEPWMMMKTVISGTEWVNFFLVAYA